MHPTDDPYLTEYRALAALKRQIEAMIGGLRTICESLHDWQRTAGQLSLLAADSMQPHWSEASLAELVTLRALLLDYHAKMERLRKAWGAMNADQRVGLADPGTLAAVPAERRPPA